MSDLEFNKDIDKYVKEQRRKNTLSYIQDTRTSRVAPEEVVEETTEDGRQTTDGRGQMAEERSPTADTHSPQRKGLFKRLFSAEKRQEPLPLEEPHQDPQATAREDIRALGMIALSTLRLLPARELKDFKNSAHYTQLQEILTKHGLLKKKE